MQRILASIVLSFVVTSSAFAGGVMELAASQAVATIPGYAFCGDSTGRLTIYGMRPGLPGHFISAVQTKADGGISDLIVSPNNRYLAVIGKLILSHEPFQRAGIVEIYDLAPGQPTRVPMHQIDDDAKQCLAFSPDNKVLATLSGGRVGLWNIQTGQLIDHPATTVQDMQSVSFSRDGDVLITAGKYITQMWPGMKKLLTPIRPTRRFGRRPGF